MNTRTEWIARLRQQECCQSHGGVGSAPGRCTDCPRNIADMLEADGAQSANSIKVNTAGTVAVAQGVFWIPIDEHAPKGVRLLLINKAAGRATDGQLGSHEKFFDHYQAFPQFQR